MMSLLLSNHIRFPQAHDFFGFQAQFISIDFPVVLADFGRHPAVGDRRLGELRKGPQQRHVRPEIRVGNTLIVAPGLQLGIFDNIL